MTDLCYAGCTSVCWVVPEKGSEVSPNSINNVNNNKYILKFRVNYYYMYVMWSVTKYNTFLRNIKGRILKHLVMILLKKMK